MYRRKSALRTLLVIGTLAFTVAAAATTSTGNTVIRDNTLDGINVTSSSGFIAAAQTEGISMNGGNGVRAGNVGGSGLEISQNLIISLLINGMPMTGF
jgi:hypothetical protein